MSRIAYVAGQYLPHREAAVHIEDRGYQFADGVYEVIAVVGGHLVDDELHLRRLRRSLGELRIPAPMDDAALKVVIREVIRRNGVETGIVYLQVTRGAAPRDHAFPKTARPTLVVTSRRSRPPDPRLGQDGIAVITIPDIRWQRCDIKSVALVANVLGKQQAREAGAYEAWQVGADGRVTEGTSTNAWIVTGDGAVITHAPDNAILNGVTRLAVLDIIAREGYRLEERPFTVEEARAARECFLTSTTADLLPVVRLDGTPIADGKPGPLSRKLRSAYLTHAAAGKGKSLSALQGLQGGEGRAPHAAMGE
jgi:D-alanine transaminase